MRIAAAVVLAAIAGMAAAIPAAQAEILGRTEQSFTVRFTGEVAADAEAAWSTMISPATWWQGEHTYSGDPGNLSLDANAGGCFCERLPAAAERPSAGPRGSVEHMRVIYAEHPRALRLAGALGPLQSEAVQGVLTVTFRPLEGGGTRILWSYNVAGSMKTEQTAPLMDRVLGAQFYALVRKLGPRAPDVPRIDPQPIDPGPNMSVVEPAPSETFAPPDEPPIPPASDSAPVLDPMGAGR